MADVVSISLRFVNAVLASSADTEEGLWPDPRERQGVRLQFLSSRIQLYASRHNGELPTDLAALANSVPSGERVSETRLFIDVWGRPVTYEPTGTMFTLRSAGPDGAWRTGDDLAETASAPDNASPALSRTRMVTS